MELKVSPQIDQVTNSDLVHTHVSERRKRGREKGVKVAKKEKKEDGEEEKRVSGAQRAKRRTQRSLRILHNQQQSVLVITKVT